MVQQNRGASLILHVCAIAIPFTLMIYWPIYPSAPDVVGPLLRPMMLFCALIMSLCVFHLPTTKAEFGAIKVFGLMLGVVLLTSMVSEHPLKSLEDVLKLLVIQLFALMMTRALRDESTAKTFGIWMYWGSIVITLFIIFTYFRMLGPVLPTYTAVRGLKGIVEKKGIPLNAAPASAMLLYLCAVCLRPMTKSVWAAGIFVALAGSVLTGSRAALSIPVLAALILLIISWLKSKQVWRRTLAIIMVLCILSSIVYVLAAVSSRTIVSLSEGRWDLWRAGMSKFLERPLLGWGFQTWRDDLVSRLPGEYRLTRGLAEHIVGGYHNEYVAALSEHGLAGFSALLVFFAYGIRSAWKLTYSRTLVWTYGKVALFGMLFIVVRANVELDGCFGFFQDPVDYASYLFLAILFSRLSLEEDASRTVAEWKQSSALARISLRLRPSYYTGALPVPENLDA